MFILIALLELFYRTRPGERLARLTSLDLAFLLSMLLGDLTLEVLGMWQIFAQ